MPIDFLSAGEGGAITEACGEHIAAGFVILHKPDAPRALLLGLGEGPWDSARDIWYNGERLDTSAYHFHPGTPSAGVDDPVQGIDAFFPAGLTYSETAYIAIRLPDTIEEPNPSAIVGRYKTRLLPDFNEEGQETARGYSSNPARYGAFLMLGKGKIAGSRINWPSWCAWRDACDGLIEWNDGISASPRQIRRFEAHVAFTSATGLPEALNLLTDLSAYCWQDDGEQIYFKPMWAQDVSFVFDGTGANQNIVEGSVSTFEVDVRDLPTRQIVRFRNLDSDYLAPASWAAKREPAIYQMGVRDAQELSYGAMTYSQAQRLSKFYLRKAYLKKRIELRATGAAFGVLPGDKVRIIHPSVDDVEALVLDTEDEATSADTRRIVAAQLTEDLYFDTDHEPIPPHLQVPTTPTVE